MVETIVWSGDRVVMIDQRRLPLRETYVICRGYRSVIRAIQDLVIRGAPAIGVAGAMGVALGAIKIRTNDMARFRARLSAVCKEIAAARPTAVNLAWAVERMERIANQGENQDVAEVKARLVAEAQEILNEDIAINKILGHHGQKLLGDGSRVLTHCNAGALATGGYGTALGVVRAAVAAGKHIEVFADETRPFLQGARLTAWELDQSGIPVTLITDNAAGHIMKAGLVDAVIVGADRIASNGDVANKIGTYMVAVSARANKIPFYVAAPRSTVDLAIRNGDDIPIEERDCEEVTHFQGRQCAPPGIPARNPAFDVTPSRYVTAIITERGVIRAPYKRNLRRVLGS